MSWKDILKRNMSDYASSHFPALAQGKLERQILSEIEKEGGALGMKNLKQFGEESELKEALSRMEKEGKIFMHKDGDIYTHEPKK